MRLIRVYVRFYLPDKAQNLGSGAGPDPRGEGGGMGPWGPGPGPPTKREPPINLRLGHCSICLTV